NYSILDQKGDTMQIAVDIVSRQGRELGTRLIESDHARLPPKADTKDHPRASLVSILLRCPTCKMEQEPSFAELCGRYKFGCRRCTTAMDLTNEEMRSLLWVAHSCTYKSDFCIEPEGVICCLSRHRLPPGSGPG